MVQTAKEIAFLRGLTVEPEWTQRFTDLFDGKVKIGKIETLTYLNAGCGNHAIEIQEKLGAKTQVFPVCESAAMADNAQIKAEVTKTAIDFSTNRPMAESDLVIADASLLMPVEISDFAAASIKASKDRVAIFLPTAGSYGEVFSILWELLAELGIKGQDEEITKLITEQPTVSLVEELLAELGLREIEVFTITEDFDFETGTVFVESPLLTHFFFPKWLSFLTNKDKKRVLGELAQKIDDDRDEMTFRFTVKATVFHGKV